jgi:hypothetical protein
MGHPEGADNMPDVVDVVDGQLVDTGVLAELLGTYESKAKDFGKTVDAINDMLADEVDTGWKDFSGDWSPEEGAEIAERVAASINDMAREEITGMIDEAPDYVNLNSIKESLLLKAVVDVIRKNATEEMNERISEILDNPKAVDFLANLEDGLANENANLAEDEKQFVRDALEHSGLSPIQVVISITRDIPMGGRIVKGDLVRDLRNQYEDVVSERKADDGDALASLDLR